VVKTALEEFAFLIPLLPALAFVITFFFGRKMPSGGAIVPILAIAASFIISLMITLRLLANPNEVISQSYPWFAVLNIGVLIDPLAAVMLSMVSFVSLLIHIYAVSYMSGDPGEARYFAETALFTAAMLSGTFGQYPSALCFLGTCRAVFLSLNWLLVRKALSCSGCQEGFPDNQDRRCDVPYRNNCTDL